MTHTLALEIDYAHEQAGWIECQLVIDGEYHLIYASYSFSPFKLLLYFVRAVAGQRLPAKFFWQEEGRGVDFIASPVAEDSPLMHLYLKHDRVDQPWFDDVIERETVIQAFFSALMDMGVNYESEGTSWHVPGELLAKVQREIEHGTSPRSDITRAMPFEISIKGDYLYEDEYASCHLLLYITINEYRPLLIPLPNGDPFWKEWVDFVGKIARAELPAQCEYYQEAMSNESDDYDWRTTFVAEPLDHPRHFRMKIFSWYSFEPEILLTDEVLDRLAFAGEFASIFKRFLREEYRFIPDGEENPIDLRTLSLDKLTGSQPD